MPGFFRNLVDHHFCFVEASSEDLQKYEPIRSRFARKVAGPMTWKRC